MGIHTQKDLEHHIGHDIVCVSYGGDRNVAIECETCNMVLADVDKHPEFWNLMDSKYKTKWQQKYKAFADHLYHRLQCASHNGTTAIICENCDGMAIFEPQEEHAFDNIFIADAAWYASDLRLAFKKLGIPYTKENIQAFLDSGGSRRFAAGIVSAGWEVIKAIVADFKDDDIFDLDMPGDVAE